MFFVVCGNILTWRNSSPSARPLPAIFLNQLWVLIDKPDFSKDFINDPSACLLRHSCYCYHLADTHYHLSDFRPFLSSMHKQQKTTTKLAHTISVYFIIVFHTQQYHMTKKNPSSIYGYPYLVFLTYNTVNLQFDKTFTYDCICDN